MTSDVMKYVTATTEQLKMNVASDLSITKEDRLATKSPRSARNVEAPITKLPKEVQAHLRVCCLLMLGNILTQLIHLAKSSKICSVNIREAKKFCTRSRD